MHGRRNQFATYPSLQNRVVVVTGGASGIGEAIVEASAAQHARVAFLDVQDAAAERLIKRLAAKALPSPVYYRCDLRDNEAIQSTVASILETFGGVDVLINNVGNDTRHSTAEVSPAFWDQCIAINLKAQFFVVQGIVPSMQRAQRGSIINMSSISWQIPSADLPVYVTAKAAVVGMTRAWAHEFGVDNIRVNCIMPGAIATEKQKELHLTEDYRAEVLRSQALKRLILPEEVARLVLFLAADDSAAITNQSYVIDGGWI